MLNRDRNAVNPSYAPLDVVEHQETSNPLHEDEESSSSSFTIKIMYKDKQFDLEGLQASSTIGALKKAVAKVTDCPLERQRFIFCGKQLQPESKLLSSFKITAGSTLHLFPKAAVVNTPINTGDNGNSDTSSSTRGPGDGYVRTLYAAHGPARDTITPLHFDPRVSQTGREVKLWCLILFFLSVLTLFNNLSFIISSGKIGNGPFDSFVTLFETAISAAGVYVSQLGLNSVRTLELEDIRIYVRYLLLLCACAMAYRVIWVVDIVMQVKRDVEISQQNANNSDNSDEKNNDVHTDNPNDNNTVLDPKIVSSFATQASIIAMICMLAWLSCVARALRLRNIVQSLSREENNDREAAVSV